MRSAARADVAAERGVQLVDPVSIELIVGALSPADRIRCRVGDYYAERGQTRQVEANLTTR